MRVLARVRPPGEAFGPPEVLDPWRPVVVSTPVIAAGVDGAGTATVAWIRGRSRRGAHGFSPAHLTVASAAPGAPFSAPQTLGADADYADAIELAVAADGRALLAATGFESSGVFERDPGGSSFHPALLRAFDEVALALRDDGAAIVAEKGLDGGIRATVRAPGGDFGPLQTIVPSRRNSAGGSFTMSLIGEKPGPPPDDANAELHAAIAPDGAAVLTWVAPRAGEGSVPAVHVARGTLAGGFRRPDVLGCPCRAAGGTRPVRLPDGRLVVAWTDNRTAPIAPGDEAPTGGGRLHVAVPGAGRSNAPLRPIHVAVRALGPFALRPGQPLRLRARCDAACDLRATAIALIPGSQGLAVRRHGATVRVRVIACSPSGPVAGRASVPVHLRGIPPRPVAAPLGVRAVRAGGRIVVRWHVAAAARGTRFAVEARDRRGRLPRSRSSYAAVSGRRGVRRYRVVLRPRRPASVRWVSVMASRLNGGPPRETIVRVVRAR